jgi:EmrB/QacA subfamily drug resistance transporter
VRARLFAPENRQWWTLAAVAFGLFMIMLDNTVVNVALPTIREDLGITISQLEWVVNGYALTFGVLLLTGGKLADLLGRRLIFIVGLGIFAASSLACGLAENAELLVGARVVQGVGAALMNPATLSIITATFPPARRGMAIGIWAGVSALALAIGPLVGGVITQHVGWSWIFFINVPIGVLGIAAARAFIDESRDTSHEQRLDPAGLVTSAVGLFALTYALIETNHHSWTSGRIIGLFSIAAIALAAFVVLELRQRIPMLDLSLFRDPTFAGANTAMMLVGLAMFGVFFFVSIYLQNVLGFSATEAGATFLPMTVLIILVAPQVGRLSDRLGQRWFVAGGLTLVSLSLLLFTRLDVDSTFWTALPGLLVGGLGMGMAMTTMTAAAMGSVPVDKAGVGSAVINSMRQVGGSLGIAVMGALLATQFDVNRPTRVDFVDGFHLGLRVAAAIALAGAILAAVTIRRVRHEEAVAGMEAAA